MPSYDLCAIRSDGSEHLGTIEANDADEAILLSTIRLERREMELRRDGVLVARFTRHGRCTRVDDPGRAMNPRPSLPLPSADSQHPVRSR